ncbi:hypothetical protein HIM_04758 [Hirsutella minnesotensis 3608]|uniref:DUF8035 domain-containing protein n=1 Tax=Hirsutella minnesotensis 3608 TaxID=1043627 RepID=A0A0F8A5U4_9HYPO|nr:hypothetical protein HIM_04758 [Hirsutella minnesotensis 3608]
MTDRYRTGQAGGAGRSATFNPARASLPTSIGYSSLYAGDMQVMPSATPRHHVATPRGYATSSTSSGVPTTTRTYTVAPDARQRSSTRESSRARRSTLDSASRPPVIITTTTTQRDRPHGTSSHSNTRSGSPIRDEYRASDGQFYAQPASSIRSRSTARPYHVTSTAGDDLTRFRDRGDSLLSPREVDAYRSSRPSVVYPSDPRHSTAAVDYGNDGYQYTNAGELARYDLDLAKPSRQRRQESIDRGYYRPNVNYNADQRSFNVNTSHDLSRNYNMNTSRPYDGRAGPPPSTRGFDRINREYDSSRELPPAAPVPPSPTAASSHLEPSAAGTERWESGRRSRPLSLHQDGAPRSSHHDDYHRSREDERRMREVRDREHDIDRTYDPPRFKDEGVSSRGFGIRTEPPEDMSEVRERRRETRPEEPKRRSDEFSSDERFEKRESRRDEEGADKERSRLRDKVAAGLSVAATAVGLAPSAFKDDEKRETSSKEPKRRRSPDEDDQKKESLKPDPTRSSTREHDAERSRDGSVRSDSRVSAGPVDHTRRDTEAKSTGGSIISQSDSDDGRRTSRRQAPAAFNPNDAADLKQLKEQLAAMEAVPDRDAEETRSKTSYEERPVSRSPSPSKGRDSNDSAEDASRGPELAMVPTGTKQVRVVSPPRDKADEKPLKGILKQPSARFPEESNPVREGVAPHKEDKKLKEAPAGARWTKINRKIVNPEALTIGKERFEIRDDFVIVLRVLSKEEIQAYAAATQVLRERRRNKVEGERDREREQERDHDGEGSRRQHRHHHHRDEDDQGSEDRDRDRDRERERRRRHRRDDDDDHESRARDSEHHHSRSYRDKERGAEV